MYGWAQIGKRVIDHVPHGHWKTTTFLTALSLLPKRTQAQYAGHYETEKPKEGIDEHGQATTEVEPRVNEQRKNRIEHSKESAEVNVSEIALARDARKEHSKQKVSDKGKGKYQRLPNDIVMNFCPVILSVMLLF